ncbi:MAG: YceI family protein [Bacteroidetes bacterium]|nr:YceI family protein [Bacteroidota bacterium]
MKWTFLLFCFFTGTLAFAQSSYLVTKFEMKIKGTSNLHNWESSAYEVRANGNFTVTAGTLKSLQSLYLEIPVKTIKSTKGSVMDNKTYDALKASSNPNIMYKFDKLLSLGKRDNVYDINTAGYLTIAGSTHRIEMYVQGQLNADGSITFIGSKSIKMTDYNVSPPTALMGTLTTGNDVEIAFQITFKQI